MGALHGISPYLHGPNAITGDPSYPFTGLTWVGTPSVYGPLFTLLSYAIAPLGLAAAMWTFKLLSAAASLACVALVWSCARRRGVAPLPAALFVGLNPLLLVWAVGGGHNDLLMIALMLAGVRLALARRSGAGAAAIVSASAMKLSAGILLPFLALGMRGEQRRRTLAGTALAAAGLAVAALVAFGTAPFGLGRTIGANAGDWHSIPGLISRLLLGSGAPSGAERLCLSLLTAAICLELARRVWRNRIDWIVAAGWATFWTLLLSPVLLPWYAVWLTPLAALGDRRLRRVALAFTVLVVTIRLCDFLPANLDSLGLRPPTG
jgi:alpha-1,6-mannosyltransferase